MKKRILACLLALVMVLSLLTVVVMAADDTTVLVPVKALKFDGGKVQGIEEAWLSANSGKKLAVTIPDNIDGVAVTGIGENAFAGLRCVESVRTESSPENSIFELPESLKEIGARAFQNCFADGVDAKVKIPKTVRSIGSQAFDDAAITQIVVMKKSNSSWDNNFEDFAIDAFQSSAKPIIIFNNKGAYLDFSWNRNSNSTGLTITRPVTVNFYRNGQMLKSEIHLYQLPFGYVKNQSTGFWENQNYELPAYDGEKPTEDRPGYEFAYNGWKINNTIINEDFTLTLDRETVSAYPTVSGDWTLMKPKISYLVDETVCTDEQPYMVQIGDGKEHSVGVQVEHPLLKSEKGTDTDYVYFKYNWWDEYAPSETGPNTVNGPRSEAEPNLFSNAETDRKLNCVMTDQNTIPITEEEHARTGRSQYLVVVYGYIVKNGGTPELFYKSAENFIHFGSGSVETTVNDVYLIQVDVKKAEISPADSILPLLSISKKAPKLNTRDHFAYVQGYPDGTVKPAGSITRAEVAAILFRLMDADSRSLYYSTASGFRDVDSTKWYNTYVATLNNAGVITDSRTGYFRPNDAITRAELAAMLAQFAEKKSAAIYFSDISAGYWAANAIALTANLGWINGYPDGTFGPDKTVTRAELMAMVNRATGRAPESTGALLSGMKTWKDNADTARWYYLDVQEATNSHTYTGAPTETWTSLTAAPDWSQYE